MRSVAPISHQIATKHVVAYHYLHRRCSISYAYGIYSDGFLMGVVTFGCPPSRHLQVSVCPSDPSVVLELNRLWIDDSMPKNTASWFVARALKLLPPRIVVSYADPAQGHVGYVYRALNFYYAGWTDMERRKPRYEYLPAEIGKHTHGITEATAHTRILRTSKVKYWIVTGEPKQKRALRAICAWPIMDWRTCPPPLTKPGGEAAGRPPTRKGETR